MPELWDLYNEKGECTGITHERGHPIPQGMYHLVVSAWITNNKGQFLLSQRHPDKPYPLYWECTGGSVLAGESSLDGAIREVKEELGIELDRSTAHLLFRTRRDSTQDFYDVWLFQADVPIQDLNLQSTEVVNARWVDKDELLDMFRAKKLHPLIDYISAYKIFSE